MGFEKLKSIFNQFDHQSEFLDARLLDSGHINHTYLIITMKKPYFVLQKVNQNVFKNVAGLIENKLKISKHLSQKFEHLSEVEKRRNVLTFVETKNGKSFYKNEENEFWNLMFYIDESQTFETVKNKEIAFESGKLIGEFLNLTKDFDVHKLVEVIPKFHDLSFRFSQFEESLITASKERLLSSKKYIELVKSLQNELLILEKLKNEGKIKTRVTHNDTKISNMLFDKNNKGLCVIDTDTVMPGIIHYDFGDAVRSVCSTAKEDETNLSLVTFNYKFYNAYKKGFLKNLGNTISKIELEHLPTAVKSMIFIIGLRFLTDYLNNDIYYKIKYANHNLDRAKNQFKLLESFTEQLAKNI